MPKIKIGILIVLFLFFLTQLNSLILYTNYVSNTNDKNSKKTQYWKSNLPISTNNFSLVNSSITNIRYGTGENDPIGSLEYFAIDFGNECSLSFFYVEEEIHNQGRFGFKL